ncbi:hypothetical protein MPTK1_2g05110 [Marchantia polymorpha subsp. ruderalis]|uniref:Protein kinase domain-containing protein n=1 Tax=Marchantia polymorpha TaxID=3197 RepID=A0A2R6X7X7_MARPO|nr:hypothetical protein MARPO_0031s0165 [Marchantia polymorpha]BBN01151.1 hypothetical protein Mp_2g05110 [Marchantia polymorpha subsp. ruderalis]|eukprot:PTQ42202.1 hypothetical protein MARPO_0031s0165 [Marchantia polymorpha]
MARSKRKRCHSPASSVGSDSPKRKKQKCEETRFLLERLRRVQMLQSDEEFDTLYELDRVNGKLGYGSFATVRTCREKASGNIFACKEVSKKKLFAMSRSAEMIDLTYNEAACFTEILPEHENIVKVYKIYESPNYIYMIMELLEKDTLAQTFQRYSCTDARVLFRKIMQAVKHLHEYGVIHRDLNIGMKNICFRSGDTNSPVIVDLNLSIYLPHLATRIRPGFVIDQVFSDRELKQIIKRVKLDDEPPSFDDDVSSLGKILSVLLTGDRQPKDPPCFKPGCHPQAVQLLCVLLDNNQRRALTIEQILNHPWFQSSD